MQSLKTGILLVNLGTPDSPSTADVRKYLREFLSDPRVIDISPLGRFALVNFIIAPFRAPKSAKLYKEIWNQNGSPLLYYTQKQKIYFRINSDLSIRLNLQCDTRVHPFIPSLKNSVHLFSKK